MEFFTKVKDWRNSAMHSNGLMIGMVYATLMVDSMLLTAVVPILPEFFFKKHQETVLLQATTNIMFATTNLQHSEDFNEQTTPTMLPQNSSISSNPSGMEPNRKNCNISAENAFLSEENIYMGVLFASKPIVQMVANSAVGPTVDAIGFALPMLVGYIVMCASAIIFSFGRSYSVLLVARALQGIGSACASTAGIGMLASRYDDDAKRGRAIGIAMGGLALGVLTGPTFGGVVYELAGKESVFLILAGLAVLLALGLLIIRDIRVEKRPQGEQATSLLKLLRDPYILLVAGSLMLGNMSVGVLEVALPIWMIKTMCSPKWALGVAFLPTSASYLVSTNLSALCCQERPRWLMCLIGLCMISAGCVGLPFARSLPELIPPGSFIGGGIGFVDTSMFPVMGFLVDTRHTPVYGNVYAIADIAFCAAFIIGPLAGGAITRSIGFNWMLWLVAILTISFAPLLILLRKPYQVSEETLPILYRAKADELDNVSTSERNGTMMDIP